MNSFFVLLGLMLMSSNPTDQKNTGIVHSPILDSLENKHIAYNIKYPTLGYRILIFSQSGNYSQKAALDAQSEFDLTFPQQRSYLSYEEPYFKVKVGNYKSRLAAYRDLRTLQQSYHNAYIVVDAIESKELFILENDTIIHKEHILNTQ